MKPNANDITCPIGEFITADARARLFTGILFSAGRTPLYLHFRQGQLINIESWDPVYSLASFALAAGLVTQEQYGRVRAAQLETGERFVELLKKESGADHTTILRLYEAFAYLTLLHLIRENGDFSAAEGAVAADPVLIEAISPERFTDRLTALVDDGKSARILQLWWNDIEVNDPACGFESGSAAASFIRTTKRFPDHLGAMEKALASHTVTEVALHTPGAAFFPILVPVVLLFVVWGLMLMLYAAPQRQIRHEAKAAALQIETLRGELPEAINSLAFRMRAR